jgi:two-component system LytT family sensor kinase
MKRSNYYLGIIISIGISLIASLPKFFKSEFINWSNISYSITYTFIFSTLCWFIILFSATKYKVAKFKNRVWYSLALITIVILTSLIYDTLFTNFTSNSFQITEIKNDKKIYIIILRGLVTSGLYFFIIIYLKIFEEKQKALMEIEYLKQAQLQANITSLKEQLSPHFLFNTLNTLTTITNDENVKEYVVELANVYRYVLQYQNKDLVTLKQEIDFVISYLFILKTRMENAIKIDIDINENVYQTKIPPLTIQILVENIIKHNIAATYKPLYLKIYDTNDRELIVQNNYQPKTMVATSTGIGLDNIAKRYNLLFQKEIEIIQSNGCFKVKLPIIQ